MSLLPAAAASDDDAPLPAALAAVLTPQALLPWLEHEGVLLAVRDAASGAYVHVNAAMARWLGRPAAEIVGRTDAELGAPLPAALRAAEQQALQLQPQPLAGALRFEWRGAQHDMAVWRRALRLDDGRTLLCSVWCDQGARRREQQQLHAALQQLEQQQRLNDQLRRAAQDGVPRDAASGLYPRGYFEEQLLREIDLCTREHREFALAWVALDTPADASGALLHAALGRLLRGNIRAMDAACRLDDERFAVLLSGAGLAAAYGRLEQLRRQCAAHIVACEGRELGFTVSVGLASYPHTACARDALTAACTAALERARRRGGNQVALAGIPFAPPA